MSKHFTADEVDAALCLWEAFLDARADNFLPKALDHYWNENGTCDIRCAVRDLGPDLEHLWLSLEEDHQWELEPFDWGFCPLVVSLMTKGPHTLPTKEQIIAALEEE